MTQNPNGTRIVTKYPNSHTYQNSHRFLGLTKIWLFGDYTVFEFRQNDTLFFPNTNSASKNHTVLLLKGTDITDLESSVFLSDTFSVSLNLSIRVCGTVRVKNCALNEFTIIQIIYSIDLNCNIQCNSNTTIGDGYNITSDGLKSFHTVSVSLWNVTWTPFSNNGSLGSIGQRLLEKFNKLNEFYRIFEYLTLLSFLIYHI